ncbi:MAG: glycosyl transferase [Bacteroidetes bacterium HGW-Bacteroidetes-1]|jgi:uncharacterized protein (TIGR00661 family)|nr:MAG: glycosyl transferase [Bacteroidetes bacterium HGW-Bacteroidetes-1]
MKVLYAIQGTGNGHLSRAAEVIPILKNYCNLDVMVSGRQTSIDLPYPVTYQFGGLGFTFGNNGGIDLWETFNEARLLRLKQEYASLPVKQYDLVINDFEPVSAWACQLQKVPCIALSHQSALLEPEVPLLPGQDFLGKFVLKYYAPSYDRIGFHFESYNPRIYTPVIRKGVRMQKPFDKGHFTVYLPAYDPHKLASYLETVKGIKWEIFGRVPSKQQWNNDVSIYPIGNESFTQSMVNSRGVLCGAGFETPAEALFLGKKLLVVPMKGQYEQQSNAFALNQLGVQSISSVKPESIGEIREWTERDDAPQMDYPDQTQQIIKEIFNRFEVVKDSIGVMQGTRSSIHSVSDF